MKRQPLLSASTPHSALPLGLRLKVQGPGGATGRTLEVGQLDWGPSAELPGTRAERSERQRD